MKRRGWLVVLVSSGWAWTGCGGVDSGDSLDGAADSTLMPPDDSPDGEDHSSSDVTSGGDTTQIGDVGDSGAKDGGGCEGGTLSIAGGPCMIYPPDATPCSNYSMTMATFEIYDNRDASVDLTEINSSCQPVPSGTVMTDVPLLVTTYDKTVWQVQDHADKTVLGTFVLEGNDSYSVTVQ
jgi:hypothetical protein